MVAVHGLHGHRLKSWSSNTYTCWLSEILPEQLPNAAIFSYGYPNATPITSVAQDLLVELDEARMKRSSFEIPIVFVARDIGGLVVKEVSIAGGRGVLLGHVRS